MKKSLKNMCICVIICIEMSDYMDIELKINDYVIKNGKKDNNILTFIDKEDTITFDINNLILKKENKDTKNVIDFKKKSIIYLLKENNSIFNIDININNISCENNKIIINYEVEKETFNLYITY